jgi:Holliday junction resolvase RusA-like endonuclease
MSDTAAFAFWVPGVPAPGGSKKAFIVNGKARLTDAAKGNKDWRASVAHAAREAYAGPVLEGPLFVSFIFYVVRPKSHTGKRGLLPSAPAFPTTRPDVLKLARSTEDALTGILWRDDSQTVHLIAMKRYGAQAGCNVRVSTALAEFGRRKIVGE